MSVEAIDPFPPSDPLGEALHFLRMNGAYYCRSELTAPWGLTLPPMPGYLWFHVPTTGSMWLETERSEPRRLLPGICPSCRTARGMRSAASPALPPLGPRA